MLVRYFAAARAAAGIEAETLLMDVPTAPSRRQVEDLLAARHRQSPPGQPPLAQVLARSSFLLDGVACTDPQTEIGPDAVLDVLPPFSGG